jgi:hypothetical protein
MGEQPLIDTKAGGTIRGAAGDASVLSSDR